MYIQIWFIQQTYNFLVHLHNWLLLIESQGGSLLMSCQDLLPQFSTETALGEKLQTYRKYCFFTNTHIYLAKKKIYYLTLEIYLWECSNVLWYKIHCDTHFIPNGIPSRFTVHITLLNSTARFIIA